VRQNVLVAARRSGQVETVAACLPAGFGELHFLVELKTDGLGCL